MDARLHVSRLSGQATVPPSKSAAHRAVLCAALADGVSHITNIEYSQDIRATLGAVTQLGAKVAEEPAAVTITGRGSSGGFVTVTRPVFCNESGRNVGQVERGLRQVGGQGLAGGVHRLAIDLNQAGSLLSMQQKRPHERITPAVVYPFVRPLPSLCAHYSTESADVKKSCEAAAPLAGTSTYRKRPAARHWLRGVGRKRSLGRSETAARMGSDGIIPRRFSSGSG